MVRRILLTALCCIAFRQQAALAQSSDSPLFKAGNIKVFWMLADTVNGEEITCNAIMRDGIVFGENLTRPDEYRRMPLTYYHPRGPLGVVLGKFDWFPGKANVYASDARMVAALASAADCGLGHLPMSRLAALWSEPPVAVIGMAAGTPAAYARPYQHMHFYEPSRALIDLIERKDERLFHFVPDARDRGALIRIVEGSPRQQLRKQGPRGFYHVIVMEACSGENGEKLFLDLFTKEGIAECMTYLANDGILCVHTSHRFVNLPPPLASIAAELKLSIRRGQDMAPGAQATNRREIADLNHFSSEWVMLARDKKTLDAVCKAPPDYDERLRKERRGGIRIDDAFWTVPRRDQNLWTDQGPNLLHEDILRSHPVVMRYDALLAPLGKLAFKAARLMGADLRTAYDLQNRFRTPRAVDQALVGLQLQMNPRIDKLWPSSSATVDDKK